MKKLTGDEFEKGYAERSHVTVEWLHANGRYGVPCDCGEKGCCGWQMVHLPTKGHKDQLRERYKLPEIIKAFRSLES